MIRYLNVTWVICLKAFQLVQLRTKLRGTLHVHGLLEFSFSIPGGVPRYILPDNNILANYSLSVLSSPT